LASNGAAPGQLSRDDVAAAGEHRTSLVSPDMIRLYTWFNGLFLLLQGSTTLAARLIPALDADFPVQLEQTRMVPSHSLLHIATALCALVMLQRAGPTVLCWFVLAVGLFYVGLAGVGMATGSITMLSSGRAPVPGASGSCTCSCRSTRRSISIVCATGPCRRR
jgi:hypothetical protein